MQVLRDLFTALSSIFNSTNKATKAFDKLIDQTAMSLEESRIEAAASLRDKKKELNLTQDELDQIIEDLYK